MKTIPYARQEITADDIAAVSETLRSDFLTQGPEVEKFETEFARFVGAPHALTVHNGTAALHLAALALGVKPGDRVLVPSNTFVASANCIRYCGGDVEFVDLDPRTLCLDLAHVEKLLRAQPRGYYKGMISVDFAGYPADQEKLRALATQHNLFWIEDACHALGAKRLDSKGVWHTVGDGSFADLTVFSFHPVKHLATGEGGMVTTRDSALFAKLKKSRSHGITRDANEMSSVDGPWSYEMQSLGYNYRMPDILCALGRSQLSRMESNLASRRKIAARYLTELKNTKLVLPELGDSIRHAFHLFVVQTEERARLYAFLKERGILTQVHYIPVHTQPYYRDLYGSKSLPATELYYARALSLPMYHSLSNDDQSRVIAALKEFAK